MYISIERNTRGSLNIEVNALNKLIANEISSNTACGAKNISFIEVSTDFFHDNVLYVLVKIKLEHINEMLDEIKLNKGVEEVIMQTLNIKPKNIAVAYIK